MERSRVKKAERPELPLMRKQESAPLEPNSFAADYIDEHGSKTLSCECTRMCQIPGDSRNRLAYT